MGQNIGIWKAVNRVMMVVMRDPTVTEYLNINYGVSSSESIVFKHFTYQYLNSDNCLTKGLNSSLLLIGSVGPFELSFSLISGYTSGVKKRTVSLTKCIPKTY